MHKRQDIALFLIIFFMLPALTLAGNAPILDNLDSELVSQVMLQDNATGTHMLLDIPIINSNQVAGDHQNYDRFSLNGEAFTGKTGWPELPIVSRTILVPPSARVRLVVNSVESHIENSYSPFIVPEQTDISDYDSPGIGTDEYLSHDGFWPPEAISIAEPAILRGYRLVTITMSPLQYNPITGDTKVNSNFDFELVYDDGEPRNPVRHPERVRPSMYVHKVLRHLVENPPPEPDRDDIMSGSYLLIAPIVDGIEDGLAPLIEWRQRQGHKVVVQYLQNGAGSGTIGNIIDEAYEEWENPVEFVTLVGDQGGSYRLGASSGNGDYNYTRVDGNDPLPDIALGRISVRNRTELDRVINKIVMYESDPWMVNLGEGQNWFEQGAVVAGHQGNGLGTVLVARYVEQSLYRIGYQEVDGWFHNIDFEIPNGQNQQFVTDVFEWGISAFVYRAYQYCNRMPRNQINNLPNTDGQWPPVIAISCDTGSIVPENQEPAYSEVFFRSRGGGVGAIGTATPGTNVRFNNIMAGGAFSAMYKYGLWAFGWGLNMGKYELWRAYDRLDGLYMSFMDWNNLIGDAATHIWTNTPQVIAVDHAETISIGESIFTVHAVDAEDESPVEFALVCLFKGEELHDVAYTDAEGVARFNIPSDALSEGEMMVTVTKHNVKPYLGTTEVGEQELYLGAQEWMINDEEGGDGDNVANPAESFVLNIDLMNFGTAVPEGEVSITATSLSLWAEVSEEAVVIEASPEVGEAVGIEFSVEMNTDAPDESVVLIELTAVNGESIWNSMIAFEVEAPKLVISNIEYVDGDLARGESKWVEIELTNIGNRAINEFSATLTSSSEVIDIINGGAQYPALEPGESAIALGDNPSFQIGAHIFTIPGMQTDLTVSAVTEAGFHNDASISVQISSPNAGDPFGPDQYGYVCFDSNDEGWDLMPVYDWVEIDPTVNDNDFDGIDTEIRDTGDNQDESDVFDLPFVFKYYGHDFDKITICSNGWAALGEQPWLASFRNRHIAQALGPDAHLAVFWDNLLVSRGELLYYHDEEGGRFIIEWSDVRRLVENGQGAQETFQIILYDVRLHPTYSGDGIIDYQYKDVTNQNARARSDTPFATVGIGNLDDSDGLEYTYWNSYSPGAAELEDGLAIRFTNATEYIMGVLTGTVTNARTGEPVVDAQISTSRGFWGRTDENGRYMIDDILIGEGYSVTATKLGYNDSTLVNNGEGFEIIEAETTAVSFALLHPEFNIDVVEFHFQMNADDSLDDGLTLSNDGDGTLVFDSKFIYVIDQEEGASGADQLDNPDRDDADDIWDPLLQWSASDSVDDIKLQGIAFVDEHWIISGAGDNNREESWFYKFDRWGNFVERIRQPVYASQRGLLNLVYDKGYLYGTYKESDLIMRIDPETGDSMKAWTLPDDLENPSCLAIDNDGYFWVAALVGDIFKLELVGDSVMTEVATFDRNDPDNPGERIRTYGFAWFRDDPDSYNLYMVSSDERIRSFAIHKLNPESGEIRFLTALPDLPEGSRGRGGITITPKWNNLVYVVGLVVDNTNGDFVYITELAPNSSWIDYSPRSDTLFAAESVPIDIMIETADLDTGSYAVVIEFSHNAEAGLTRIEVELVITTLSAPDDNYVPIEYSLEQNWPNPFNPSTSISYSLRKAGLTKLSVFDIMGREVMELVNENQSVGRYRLSFDGSVVPAGMYFYKITSGDFTSVKKMLLIK